MGNYRSGRWSFHTARQTTGESKRIYPKDLRAGIAQLSPGYIVKSTMSWSCRGKPSGNIFYQLEERGAVLVLRLIYAVTQKGKDPAPYDYRVIMTSTTTVWGALRWWFMCPAADCGRRVGVLYLPPVSYTHLTLPTSDLV